MARHPFLEQIKRAREAAEKPVPEATAKSIEEMSDEELEQAERAARRHLLDLQHQELRERELARVSPGDGSATQAPLGKAAFAAVLREKQRKKRRNWR